MNGPQDMGGMMGFGPVIAETNEPVFHAAWERRALAITLAVDPSGMSNIDAVRHARESTPALKYWSANYYDIRIEAHIKLMIENGLIAEAEMASGRMQVPPKPVKGVLTADMVAAVLAKGGPANRHSGRAARFRIGDRVRARNIRPQGHTRLPRYARGRLGEIVLVHGTHLFPDSSAHGLGDDPQWLYSVRFSAAVLWGHDSCDSMHIDLWEPYLEASP